MLHPTTKFLHFLKIATEARAAQKRYFRFRKTADAKHYLAESLALERQLDKLILEYNQAEQLQQPLYNDTSFQSPNSKLMFFQNLAQHAPNLDVQIRIMAKDGKLTVSVLPLTTEKLKALTVTATPQELDAEFFNAILQPVNNAATIEDQVAEYRKVVEGDLAEKKQAVDKEAEKTLVAPVEAETPKEEQPAEKPVKKSRSKKTRFAASAASAEDPKEEPAEDAQPEPDVPVEAEAVAGIVNGEPWPPAPDEPGTEKTDSPATEEPSEKPNWEVVHTDVEPETKAPAAIDSPAEPAETETTDEVSAEKEPEEEQRSTAFPEIVVAQSEQIAAAKPAPPRPTPALF